MTGIGGRLILREPRVKNALELNVGISQRLTRVALLKGVPYFFCRALALNELGNIWRDAKANVAHYALVVLVLVILGSGCLVNVGLVLDISVSACNG
jgi:hypothetical protein